LGGVAAPVRLNGHKMYPQVEEGFNAAGDHRFSPAEPLGLPHRRSPS
jgi:hypothetical protein